jgi:hypothetical protein
MKLYFVLLGLIFEFKRQLIFLEPYLFQIQKYLLNYESVRYFIGLHGLGMTG